MNKLTLAIACMNQTEETKGQWGMHVQNIADKENVELLVIDNGSTDGLQPFLENFVFPYFPDHRIIRNEQNIGVVASYNQIMREAKGDVVAILHNDVYVFEYGWDRLVKDLFLSEQVGLAGFLGATGLHENGGRIGTKSNLLEAQIHGERTHKVQRVSHFDALALIVKKEMWEKVGGFDENLKFNHFHDRDISVASHYAGYENWLLPVFCHHRSGITANRPDYGKWIAEKMGTKEGEGDLASYRASETYFLNKWKGKLPINL